MTERGTGCLPLLLILPSAIVHTIRQTAWHNSFPRPYKLHTVERALEIIAALDSEHGGIVDAFPYVQRVLELDPQNISAAKFMASHYMVIGKPALALPFLKIAAQGAHPDSIYLVMLEQALDALDKQKPGA